MIRRGCSRTRIYRVLFSQLRLGCRRLLGDSAFSRGVLNFNHAPSSARRMLECWHPGLTVGTRKLVMSFYRFVHASPPNVRPCASKRGRRDYVPGAARLPTDTIAPPQPSGLNCRLGHRFRQRAGRIPHLRCWRPTNPQEIVLEFVLRGENPCTSQRVGPRPGRRGGQIYRIAPDDL